MTVIVREAPESTCFVQVALQRLKVTTIIGTAANIVKNMFVEKKIKTLNLFARVEQTFAYEQKWSTKFKATSSGNQSLESNWIDQISKQVIVAKHIDISQT